METLSVVEKQTFMILGLVAAIALVLFGLKGYQKEKPTGMFILLGQPLLTYSLQQVKEEINLSGEAENGLVENLGFTSTAGLPQESLPEIPIHWK